MFAEKFWSINDFFGPYTKFSIIYLNQAHISYKEEKIIIYGKMKILRQIVLKCIIYVLKDDEVIINQPIYD